MLGMNIPAVLLNVIVVAFFVVIALGVVIGAYAASTLKKREKAITKD